jgi:parallel beta-helix repeat protein
MASNQFNTTPNGTTVVDVNNVIGSPTTLVLESTTTPYLDNILILNPGKTTFILKPGTYGLVNILKIQSNDIKIVGYTGIAKDVQINQTMNYDGILLQADNIVLQDITIKCTFSNRCALITASANNTLVSGCTFYCTNDTFGIYYAGPSHLVAGSDTLIAYTTYVLDTGNIFYNNVVYSDFSGDSVSYSLQYNGQFVKNFIRGGKVAIYMCRTVNVYSNTLMDSTTNGLYISFPSDNLTLLSNVISNTTYSSIIMKNQVEHGTYATYPYNILIRYNTIFGSKFYGIEMNNASNITISDNTIVSGKVYCIYSYSSDSITVNSNKIAYFSTGIMLENTTNSTVTSNGVMSVFPNLGQNGIKLTNTSSGLTISNNTMQGSYVHDLIADSGIGNTVTSNTISPYYTMSEELNMYAII